MVHVRAFAAVLAVALLAVAGVSGFRATVTTSIDEGIDQHGWGEQGQQLFPQRRRHCRQQIQQWQLQLQQCQQFLQQSQGSPLELPMYNQQQQQQQLRQCCQRLRNFDQQCHCEAVRHVVQQLQQGQDQYGQGQQVQHRKNNNKFFGRLDSFPGCATCKPRNAKSSKDTPTKSKNLAPLRVSCA